jgi:hypothetical protein
LMSYSLCPASMGAVVFLPSANGSLALRAGQTGDGVLVGSFGDPPVRREFE